MRRFALPLAILALFAAACGAVATLRFAWGLHLRSVERSLDPIGPAPGPVTDAEAPRPRVMLFGDSRIAGWNPLPAVPGGSVIVRGRPGETTSYARLRLARDLAAVRPDVVVLQTGVNDLKAIGVFPRRAREIADATEANLRAMLETIDDGTRRVVLMTILPPARRDLLHRILWSGDVEGAVRDVNERLRALGGDRLTLFDGAPVLAPGGAVEPRYAADTLHLNAAGYAALDAAIEPVLEEILASATPGSAETPAASGGAPSGVESH